jgi:hypothetical protein
MNNKTNFLAVLLLLHTAVVSAQVQVSKEPLHKKVLENKYIRLLDVWIKPGDTSLFHIHSTPSVFLIFTTTTYAAQEKNKDWTTAKVVPGYSWYRSFYKDTQVHRVANIDTAVFHVTDVELLSAYKPTEQREALPFPLLYENKKVFAYQLTDSSFSDHRMSKRGPLIIEVVKGEVKYHDIKGCKSTIIKTGEYLYIEPGKEFSFTAAGKEKTLMILFEIK